MSSRRRPDAFGLKTAAAILVLLVVLALLQYHWLGQVGRAERDRMQAYVQSATERFAYDFNREITRAFLTFRWDPSWSGDPAASVLEEKLASWEANAPYPELIAEVLLLDVSKNARRAERLDPRTGGLAAIPWPRELGRSSRNGSRNPRFAFPILPRLPALVMPLGSPLESRSPGERKALLIRFDRTFIEQELLPELVHRHLELGGTRELEARVVDPDSKDSPIIFSTSPETATSSTPPDATAPLLALLPFQEMRRLGPELGLRASRPLGLGLMRNRRARREPPPGAPPPVDPRAITDAGWRLEVRHHAGSLEAAVARTRHRNLALGMGVLTLLGVTIGMLVMTSRRSERLARQQMEFVAGVTHELQTPLAVIRSAGQNLADGVVEEPEQVKRYGGIIEREGRRLSDMVEDVLDFAGIQTRQRTYARTPVNVGALVDRALVELEIVLDEAGITVEKKIPEGLSPVQGDPEALRRVLRNLLENAAKYARKGHWIGIQAAELSADGRRRVRLTIRDRGPGIDARDLPHVFEPFYRGRGMEQTPGSGLGLSLVRRIVEAHGGRITVESSPGGGAAFDVELQAGGSDESAEPS